MKVNSSIFKSYDIRGVYPSELNEKTAYLIGSAFVNHIKARNVVVARDMRLSSSSLSKALIKGITRAGANVLDIGETPSEVMYFTVGKKGYDAGVMVTASHNPKDYNGLKFVRRDNDKILMVRGKDLYETASKNNPASKKRGKTKEIDIREDYIKHTLSLFGSKKIKPFKIVIDAGNGMAARIIPLLEKKLAIKIIPLNFNIDGSFPSHPSNPLEPGVTNQVCRAVKKEGADFGFIFDGDADRIFLVDEKARFTKGDSTLLLMAKSFLEKKKGLFFSYNAVCSKAVPDLIAKWGGKSIRTPVGFVNVQKAIIENKGIMGGETSGHYCFKDNFYADSALMAFLILLDIISVSDRPVSQMIDEVTPYVKADEINFEVKNKEDILSKIKKKYMDGNQDFLDGITVGYDNWWFNVRPSNTEPLLRLTIEADTKELLEEKKKELAELITNLK